MRTTILRIPTVVFLLVLFAMPLSQAEARSRANLKSVASKREKQIHKLEQRLEKPYGSDTWFVFACTVIQPDCSHDVVLIAGRYRQRAYAQTRMSQRLVFRSSKVQGARAAAELIWQTQRAPLALRFFYRGFENEAQADAFHELLNQ